MTAPIRPGDSGNIDRSNLQGQPVNPPSVKKPESKSVEGDTVQFADGRTVSANGEQITGKGLGRIFEKFGLSGDAAKIVYDVAGFKPSNKKDDNTGKSFDGIA